MKKTKNIHLFNKYINNNLLMGLDEILDNRIGLGKAQLIPLLFLSLVDLNDGAQLILSSFLNPVISSEWDLSSGQVSTLASIFFFGTFIGSIMSGRASDQYGRKPLILVGSFMQLFSGAFFFFVNSFNTMLLARFFYGLSFGFSIALTTSMFAEITPTKFRGKGILLINFCVSLGKIYGILLAYIFLEDFHHGNWRAMMIWSCAPNLIVFIGGSYFLPESPRFLLAHGRMEEAFQQLNHLARLNSCPDQLTESDKQSLTSWRNKAFKEKEEVSIWSLFNRSYCKITVCLMTSWMAINFIYFGQLVALPFILGKSERSFSTYTWTVLGELPNLILSLLMIDAEGFGRRKSLSGFFGVSGLLHSAFLLFPLTALSSFSRFVMKGCFQMLYPTTTESYGTLNRALGFSFNSAMGRLSAAFMPYIILPFVEQNVTWIYFMFIIISFVGAFASFKLPLEENSALDQQSSAPDSYHELKNLPSRS